MNFRLDSSCRFCLAAKARTSGSIKILASSSQTTEICYRLRIPRNKSPFNPQSRAGLSCRCAHLSAASRRNTVGALDAVQPRTGSRSRLVPGRVEHGQRSSLPVFTSMRSESDRDSRPGSSLTADSSATAHSTATHKHRSPMRRLMNGLKRLNSYSNDNSDSSSSEDDEDCQGSDNGGDGSEEFVERHQVQEIRFNYESWPLCFPPLSDL